MRQFTIVTLIALAAAITLAAPANALSGQAKAAEAKTSETKVQQGPVVNINTAPADQLERLPGVGPKTAARIIEYRQKNGGFKKIEELMNVRGIGEKVFLRMKNQLAVAAAKPDAQ